MVLAESPAALQLRYLQTLATVATEKNSTIVFPLPINMLEGIGGITYDNHTKVPNRAWGPPAASGHHLGISVPMATPAVRSVENVNTIQAE